MTIWCAARVVADIRAATDVPTVSEGMAVTPVAKDELVYISADPEQLKTPVTAHRLSSTQAFLRLPELSSGDAVDVVTGDRRYTYEIVETRETSFRSAESLAAQRAAVPGKPGVKPTRAYITLSTCSTPEDHAAGNYWSDEFGNPEHRIDKIGVLVASEPA